jgi:hypothetical protein
MSDKVQNVNVPEEKAEETKQVNVVDVPISNENVALNVMVALLNIAQRRGVYTMQESAKGWECVKMFMKPIEQTNDSESPNVTMNVSETTDAV